MPDDTEATEPKSPPTAQVLTASAAHAAAVAAKVEHSASATQQSAAATQKAAAATLQSVDRNTQLAADRTVLAAERTYAAWVRTGLSSLASGVGARALLKGTLPGWFGELTGSGLVIFSAFCFIAAVWRQTSAGVLPPAPDIKRLPFPLLLVINGFLVVIAIAALIGIWFIED